MGAGAGGYKLVHLPIKKKYKHKIDIQFICLISKDYSPGLLNYKAGKKTNSKQAYLSNYLVLSPIYLYIYLSINRSIDRSIIYPASPFIHLSSIHPSIYLSICRLTVLSSTWTAELGGYLSTGVWGDLTVRAFNPSSDFQSVGCHKLMLGAISPVIKHWLTDIAGADDDPCIILPGKTYHLLFLNNVEIGVFSQIEMFTLNL